ncbi:A/G-specific adenine glycosylase [Chlamydia sp. 17-3921]|uniref:A/G-specific adenine glycosylase n=1 Tax=Chlamydia sp. 17-3921 TaxID=2675798 RepID=UPI001918E007|nr:A/G-specific adenine glycosylase [Chlamydia sp. 17-3921]
MVKIAFFEQERNFPSEILKEWFKKNKRSFPWRNNPTPYSVWISEVMLQQTRAEVVVQYYLRWMEKFPTIQSLAEASEEEVIKAWEGLGYYSRARHLLEGARYVVQNFNGEMPNDPVSLSQIRGIGPYTTHAILAFAFKQRAAAVDGNVLRVLSRIFVIENSIDLESTRIWISRIAQAILPSEDPQIVAEALIELGACICKRSPQCSSCPIREFCGAWQENKQKQLPIRHARKKIVPLRRLVAIVVFENSVVIEQRRPKEMMAGLYEFPYIEVESMSPLSEIKELIDKMEERIGASLTLIKELEEQQQAFTHYKARLVPKIFLAATKPLCGSLHFLDDLDSLPFSSGHKKIKTLVLAHLCGATTRSI